MQTQSVMATIAWGVGLLLAGMIAGLIGLAMAFDYRGVSSKALENVISSRKRIGMSVDRQIELRNGNCKIAFSVPFFLLFTVSAALGIYGLL
jgi:hypothetical protein